MSKSISKYVKGIRLAIGMIAGLTAFLFSSCSMIFDDRQDCDFGLHIRFKYDYNMSFGDAFAAQVGRVSVYVFDENGNFVTSQTEEGEALSQEGYRMTLELPEGTYRLVCWGGNYDDSFSHHKLSQGNAPSVETLEALMLRDDNNEVKFQDGLPLRSLFWGQADSIVVNPESIQEETISLMKLTNQVKINLVNGENEPLSSENFEFYLDASNGRISADDASLLEDDLLKMYPYHIADVPGITASLSSTRVADRAGVSAEFSCARLDKDDDKLTLHAIDKNTGEDVLNFPLAKYLATWSPSAYETTDGYIHFLDAQEYLDRADLYNMTFVLKDGNWVSVEIQVEAWTVRKFFVDL